MLIQKIKFRGKNLYATSEQIAEGNILAVAKAELWELETRNGSEEIQTRHGLTNAPALLGKRKITLEGVIIAESASKRSELLKELDRTFAPEAQVSFGVDANLPLYFEDAEGKRWCVYAQVSKLPQKTDDPSDVNLLTWKVELQATDPFIYSAASYTAEDVNRTQGLTLPTSTSCGFTQGWKTLDYAGTLAGDLQITLTATADNATDGQIKIYNLTSGEIFQINEVEMNTGDVLVIDTENRKITLNEADITYKKSGGGWPSLAPGENQIRTDTNVENVRVNVIYAWREVWL